MTSIEDSYCKTAFENRNISDAAYSVTEDNNSDGGGVPFK